MNEAEEAIVGDISRSIDNEEASLLSRKSL
jgi:hypothetical protein